MKRAPEAAIKLALSMLQPPCFMQRVEDALKLEQCDRLDKYYVFMMFPSKDHFISK